MSESPQQDQTAAPTLALPPAQPAKRPAPPRVEKLPPFNVLLHNDDVNDMAYVTRTVIRLCALQPARAYQIMLTAHKAGVALVLTTHKERAELYRDQFRSKGLIATIEPATI